MNRGRFDAGDLVYRAPLSEIDSSEDMPEYVQKSLEQRGVNYNDMGIGKTSNKDWVFIKPGKMNFGRAAPANLAYSVLDDYLDINSPEISYDDEEDIIIIEHLGDIDTPHSSGQVSEGSLVNTLATKSLMGDPDIIGNLGVKEE